MCLIVSLFKFDLCLEEGQSTPVETSANIFIWITENGNSNCYDGKESNEKQKTHKLEILNMYCSGLSV